MKASEEKRLPGGFAWPLWRTPAVVLCAFAIVRGAMAQPVLVPLPPLPAEPQPPVSPPAVTNQFNPAESTTPESAAPATAVPRNQEPFQWGLVTFHPHLSYQVLYGNGIQSQPGEQHKSFVQGISPGIGLSLDPHWNVDYTPTLTFYSDKNFHSTVDHSISLDGRTAYEDWTLGLSQSCMLTSDPLIETGRQTDQQSYLTSLNVGYQFSSRASLELGAVQNFRFTQGFTNALGSSRDWSTLDWLNYQWGANLGTAVGAGVGYVDVDVGSDMAYEQIRGRITWRVTGKINLSLNGGAEIRQFLNSSQSELLTPVFGASLIYQPFEVTTISLNANRSVNSSYYQDQATETTTVSAGVNQRFFTRFYLNLNGGYANTTYQASGALNPDSATNGREDNYGFFTVSLNTAFLKRGTASVFYTTSKNSSTSKNLPNQNGFGYSSSQVGMQLAYRY